MSDRKPGAFGDFPHGGAAKVNARKAGMADGIGGRDLIPSFAAASPGPARTQQAGGQGGVRTVPPVEPDIRLHAAGYPVVGDIIHHGHVQSGEGKDEGFGQAAHGPEMDHIRLHPGDGCAQEIMVVKLQVAQVADIQPGIAKETMDAQGTVNVGFRAVSGCRRQAVIRGQNFHFMAALAQRLDDVAAAQFVTAQVMGRVERGDDEDFHGAVAWASCQPWRKPASLPRRCCQRMLAA